jgi:DNA helicase INO80
MEERKWLADVLLSDTDSCDSEISDQDEYVREMLKNHVREKKYRKKYYQNANVSIFLTGSLIH